MEEKKNVVYVLHGFWENEFTNGCAVVDVSIDLETVMKKLDVIVENKAREYVKVQEDKAEEERGFRYFEIWDENGQMCIRDRQYLITVGLRTATCISLWRNMELRNYRNIVKED